MSGGGGVGLGTIAGAALGALLAPVTGGASLGLTAAMTTGLSAAAGAALGNQMVDKPNQIAQQANDNQATANAAATANATKQTDLAVQANNRANAQSPDVGAMLSANQQAAKSGGGSTMLTGPAGVDPSTLALGKSTLLGS